MSTMTTAPIPAAAIAAQVELYREMALRFTRTLTKDLNETFDPVNVWDSRRPYTEEEAEAEAKEMAERFASILESRQRPLGPAGSVEVFDTFLLLGCDLILSLPRK